MIENEAELDRLQAEYKAAVETWVSAIRAEEALASVHHSVAELDKWEAAHFSVEHAAGAAKAAKAAYEAALRRDLFGFG